MTEHQPISQIWWSNIVVQLLLLLGVSTRQEYHVNALELRCPTGEFMKLFTPFSIPEPEMNELCRIQKAAKKKHSNIFRHFS